MLKIECVLTEYSLKPSHFTGESVAKTLYIAKIIKVDSDLIGIINLTPPPPPRRFSSMDSTRSPLPSTNVQFPFNLGCDENVSDKGKVTMDEMDFFSEKKKDCDDGGGGGAGAGADPTDLYTTEPSDFSVNVSLHFMLIHSLVCMRF